MRPQVALDTAASRSRQRVPTKHDWSEVGHFRGESSKKPGPPAGIAGLSPMEATKSPQCNRQ